jgi:Flp pilus assembly protein TadG
MRLRRRIASRRARLRRRWQEERAVVLVWFALMLVVLIGFAGFAVDLSNWWLQADRLQRAADAGAHAGVVFLPADLPTARTTARAEMAKNGYRTTGSDLNASTTITQEPNPNRLRVRLTTTVPSYFVQLLGVDEVELTREAVAEYVAPVPMGSPQNKLGNDPENADPGTQLWMNISGPQTAKAQGDRYQSRVCSGSEAECTGTTNDEYTQDGYFFAVDVTSVQSGQPLVIQVYDAAWVNTGFTCADTVSGSGSIRLMPSASQITTLTSKFPDAATRYGSVASGLSGTALADAQKFCAGDGHAGTTPVNTTFVFRQPDETPWNNTDNAVINTSSCKPVTVVGHNPNSASSTTARGQYIFNQLNDPASGLVDPNDGVLTFAETFRRFSTFCTIPAGSVQTGKYIVQVRTNSASATPTLYTSSITTAGHNKMSMRAGFGTTGVTSLDGSRVTVAALGRLPIFANSNGADTRFYLAKVLPYDAGRTLRISLFDMGEASQTGVLQVLPPAEFASTFSGCGFSRSDGASLSTNASTCTLSNVSSSGGFDGKVITIDVPIPQNYTCDDDTATGCWVRIKAQYPSGATVNDATTWSAAILGNPVRLVE